ncbi:hypothetical protein Q7C36_015852 [Tachysurus vachellii]|uniref:Uncharacterized protein n=1 Tax=Tachysurus vachellii TaxID=175792 RepID=A0AA88M7L3_TACVA|nr:hypothetical protein Q7C36_015852 [Tachysurus vachellii]
MAIIVACPFGMVSEASELLFTVAFHGTAGPPALGAHQMASERETQQGRGGDGRVQLLLVLCQYAEGAVGSNSACHVGAGNYTVAPVKRS